MLEMVVGRVLGGCELVDKRDVPVDKVLIEFALFFELAYEVTLG